MGMETLFLTCCLSRCCGYASPGGGLLLSGGGGGSMGWIVCSAHSCADWVSGADLPSEGQTVPPTPVEGWEPPCPVDAARMAHGSELGRWLVSVCDACALLPTGGRGACVRKGRWWRRVPEGMPGDDLRQKMRASPFNKVG